ncbi:hypothetical protein ABMY26_00645 (plasmid) [Azospirillum sp. HJ39]|uniref:hypothetical protein n=1 Tax=Azospirillum sp. HJ39 TaxID=3159496 RepID=UPI003558F542
MAAKLNLKPSAIPPDRISADLVVETVGNIREKKQVLSDAQMGHAGEYKAAEKKGLHTKALKLAVVMAKEEPAKRLAFWKHFVHYVTVLNLDKDPQRSIFDGQEAMPSADDVADAVGVINNGPSVDDIPPVPHPADMEGKKRLIGAWNKGVEARREGRKRSDCLLTGAESIKTFEAGWDGMDAAIKAASEGGAQPVAPATSIGGYDIPEGMSQDIFTSLFKDGGSLFRSGKSPGDHADADDPVKARVLQLGWAAEQDEQQKAKDVAAAPVMTPEQMEEIKAEGVAACHAGETRAKCRYAEGTAEADLWLSGFDEADDALFDGVGGNGPGVEDAGDQEGADHHDDEAHDDGDDLVEASADADEMLDPPDDEDDAFPMAAMSRPMTAADVFAE